MQQRETECDKHNLFYAHAFSNETNFANLIFNAMKSAVYAMKKKNCLDLAKADTLPCPLLQSKE